MSSVPGVFKRPSKADWPDCVSKLAFDKVASDHHLSSGHEVQHFHTGDNGGDTAR